MEQIYWLVSLCTLSVLNKARLYRNITATSKWQYLFFAQYLYTWFNQIVVAQIIIEYFSYLIFPLGRTPTLALIFILIGFYQINTQRNTSIKSTNKFVDENKSSQIDKIITIFGTIVKGLLLWVYSLRANHMKLFSGSILADTMASNIKSYFMNMVINIGMGFMMSKNTTSIPTNNIVRQDSSNIYGDLLYKSDMDKSTKPLDIDLDIEDDLEENIEDIEEEYIMTKEEKRAKLRKKIADKKNARTQPTSKQIENVLGEQGLSDLSGLDMGGLDIQQLLQQVTSQMGVKLSSSEMKKMKKTMGDLGL
jgi:hypothetical protein